VLDLQTIPAMYTLGSWLVQSDEIRLYTKDVQRSYAEYGTETRIEPTEANGIYSLVFIPYVLRMISKLLALHVIKYV
jgi:hypothetical protein